jgi:hypothetical protein
MQTDTNVECTITLSLTSGEQKPYILSLPVNFDNPTMNAEILERSLDEIRKYLQTVIPCDQSTHPEVNTHICYSTGGLTFCRVLLSDILGTSISVCEALPEVRASYSNVKIETKDPTKFAGSPFFQGQPYGLSEVVERTIRPEISSASVLWLRQYVNPATVKPCDSIWFAPGHREALTAAGLHPTDDHL